MADLISRAAAIEALGERPYNWTDSEAEIAEVCAWESHKSAIENIPTIDAIPVEWLHKKREQMIDAAQNRPEQAIAYVLWMWQKEQEAR